MYEIPLFFVCLFNRISTLRKKITYWKIKTGLQREIRLMYVVSSEWLCNKDSEKRKLVRVFQSTLLLADDYLNMNFSLSQETLKLLRNEYRELRYALHRHRLNKPIIQE